MLAENLYQNKLDNEAFLKTTIFKMKKMVQESLSFINIYDVRYHRGSLHEEHFFLKDLFRYAVQNFIYVRDERNPFNPDHAADEFLVSPRYFQDIKYGDCEDFSMYLAAAVKAYFPKYKVFFRVVKLDVNEPFAHVYVVVKNKNNREKEIILDAGNENPVFDFECLAVERRDYEV